MNLVKTVTISSSKQGNSIYKVHILSKTDISEIFNRIVSLKKFSYEDFDSMGHVMEQLLEYPAEIIRVFDVLKDEAWKVRDMMKKMGARFVAGADSTTIHGYKLKYIVPGILSDQGRPSELDRVKKKWKDLGYKVTEILSSR